jgi:hypothetical protein
VIRLLLLQRLPQIRVTDMAFAAGCSADGAGGCVSPPAESILRSRLEHEESDQYKWSIRKHGRDTHMQSVVWASVGMGMPL